MSDMSRKITTVNRSTTEIELDGLEKFTEYRISVAAFTSRGQGPFSADVKVRTDEDGELYQKFNSMIVVSPGKVCYRKLLFK